MIDYQSHEAEARRLTDEITGAGGRALLVKVDVSKEDQVAALVAQALDAFGALDIMVANSGLQRDAHAQRRLDQRFRRDVGDRLPTLE